MKQESAGGRKLPRHVRAAAEGDVLQPDAGAALQQFAHEMADVSDPRRAVGHLPGAALRLLDVAAQVLTGETGTHRQVIGLGGDLRGRDEGPLVVHGKVSVDERQDREGGALEQEGVAIRWRLGDRHRGDGPARAGAVLHHEGLAQVLGDLGLDRARNRIGDAAGAVGHDEAHRPVGVASLPRGRPREGRSKRGGGGGEREGSARGTGHARPP
jgi:hypothetical protein